MVTVLYYYSRQNNSINLEADKVNNVLNFLCVPIMIATWGTINQI